MIFRRHRRSLNLNCVSCCHYYMSYCYYCYTNCHCCKNCASYYCYTSCVKCLTKSLTKSYDLPKKRKKSCAYCSGGCTKKKSHCFARYFGEYSYYARCDQ